MISANNQCIGCGACKIKCPVNCIAIVREDGQYMPVVDKKRCINCKLCESVCVAMHAKQLNYYKAVGTYYGYAKAEKKRIASSSGGIFYAVAEKFIQDGGVVAGAAYGDDFTVSHKIVRDVKELVSLRGSKYVESNLQSVFKDIAVLLDNGHKVLFSGVPCQVGAIKTYLGKEYENLYCCEVFCHGVPRSGLFSAYVNRIQKKYGAIRSFNFRSKCCGWSKPVYEIETEKKKIIQQHKNNIYHLMFGNHMSLRDSCYECQFRKCERIADISLGDFWGIEKYYPNVTTNQGVSAVIINTEKGRTLVEKSEVQLEPCTLSEIYDRNTWMIMNYEKPNNQKKFINDFNSMSTRSFFRKYELKYKVTDKIQRFFRRVFT